MGPRVGEPKTARAAAPSGRRVHRAPGEGHVGSRGQDRLLHRGANG